MLKGDIENALNLKRAEALVEYRTIILKESNPSSKDIDRLFVLGTVLSVTPQDIQADISTAAEIASLRDSAERCDRDRAEYRKATDAVERKEKEYAEERAKWEKEIQRLNGIACDKSQPLIWSERASKLVAELKAKAPRLFSNQKNVRPSLPPRPKAKPQKQMVYAQTGNQITRVTKDFAKANHLPYVEKMPFGRG